MHCAVNAEGGAATGGTLQCKPWGRRGAQDCTHVLRIPLVSSQGNKEVPAVAGEGTPAGMMKIKGPVTPLNAAAEQAAGEGLLALASPP